MKKLTGLIVFISFLIISLLAQDKLFIFRIDKTVVSKYISAIDSICFAENNTKISIHNTDKTESTFLLSEIDSLGFTNSQNIVQVNYNGATATVINPFEGAGVTVDVNGASVIVNSTLSSTAVSYLLTGNTTNGMFKIYSNSKFEIQLRNADITNSAGPAINIQSKNKASVLIAAGTTNFLNDGSTYATSTEDQKSTFFSEGAVEFFGSGTLTVKSVAKHAICSDDNILISGGNIIVPSAGKDGIHSKGMFGCYNGNIQTNTSGDGIECELGNLNISGGNITTVNTVADTKGITCDYDMTISGGIISQTVSGNQAKGLRAKQSMLLTGGKIKITTSGDAVLTALGSGFDPSYCTGIKASTGLVISGSEIEVTSNGVGNKAISSDASLTINSGLITIIATGNGATYTNSSGVTDAYSFAGIDANGDIQMLGGTLNSTTSGTGSRTFSGDGNLIIGSTQSKPAIVINNTSERFLVSGTSGYATAVYCEPKGLKSDKIITINNADLTISCTRQGAECIDGDSIVNINGGTCTLTISGNQSKAVKATKELNINGGNIGITTTGGVVLENLTASTYDPSYCTALKSDANVNITNGEIIINASGIAGKGISADADVNISGGNITITVSGSGNTYSNNALNVKDSYNSSCISSDGNLNVLSGTLNLTAAATASGGKAISSNGIVTFGDASNVPVVNLTTLGTRFLVSGSDYCHPKTLVSDKAITINNGKFIINSTDDGIHSDASITINDGNILLSAISVTQGVGEGVEAPVITFNGGTTNITASNDGINATYGTVAGGTESNDGSNLYIKGGIVIVAGSDAIDSNGNITISGGVTIVCGPTSQPEEGIDFNGTFNVNGGTIISAGSNSNMTKAMNTSSTQPGMYIKSGTQIPATGMLHIENAGGTEMVTFKPKNAVYYFHFSSPGLVKSASYKIYTGGTYSGGNFVGNAAGWGMYTGGIYSTAGATLKSTSTLSSSSTVNTISF